MNAEADAVTLPAWTAEQVERGRELVALDTKARIELGDLLLEIAPWSNKGRHTGTYGLIDRFAEEIGIGSSSAHSYRRVASLYGGTVRDKIAKAGIAISYTAIRNAVLYDHDSRLLVEIVDAAVAEGRARITVNDVASATAARWQKEVQARRAFHSEREAKQAAKIAQLQAAREAGLVPWRDALTSLIEQAEGSDDATTLRDVAIQIFVAGGDPADLVGLGLVREEGHRELFDQFIGQTVEFRRLQDSFDYAERHLQLLTTDPDLTSDDVPAEIRASWRTQLDKIAILVTEIGERLR